MKKLVLTAVVVGFAAVAAQAQGTGDGGVTREAFRLFYESQHQAAARQAQAAQTADTLARAVATQAEKEHVRRAREQKEKRSTQHFSHVPATGVMRDYATEGRLQEKTQTVTKPSAEPTAQKKARPVTKKQEAASWLARAFGFAKYEGETDEEWQARLASMAMK